VTDFRLPPFDAHIKAQLDAQREQLKALPPALSPAQLAALRLPGRRGWLLSPEAQQAREEIVAWRQDIADREKDLASRQEGLRELEAYAEREYGIPAPRSAPIGPSLVDPPIASPPAAEAINDNAAAAVAPLPSPPPSEPEPQRLRGRTPVHEWQTIITEITSRCYRSGRLVVPEDENVFAEQMLHWYVVELHRQMSTSTMREAVRGVCEHLRKKLKNPWKPALALIAANCRVSHRAN
jgi:hypothetical protein